MILIEGSGLVLSHISCTLIVLVNLLQNEFLSLKIILCFRYRIIVKRILKLEPHMLDFSSQPVDSPLTSLKLFSFFGVHGQIFGSHFCFNSLSSLDFDSFKLCLHLMYDGQQFGFKFVIHLKELSGFWIRTV